MKINKLSRSYRLAPMIIEKIDLIQKHYAKEGINLSQADIVTKSINNYYDLIIKEEKR